MWGTIWDGRNSCRATQEESAIIDYGVNNIVTGLRKIEYAKLQRQTIVSLIMFVLLQRDCLLNVKLKWLLLQQQQQQQQQQHSSL
jgi:hypothetical protein